MNIVCVFVLELNADMWDCANYIVWKAEINTDVLVSTELLCQFPSFLFQPQLIMNSSIVVFLAYIIPGCGLSRLLTS